MVGTLRSVLVAAVGISIFTSIEMVIPYLALYWTGYLNVIISVFLFIIAYLMNASIFTYYVFKLGAGKCMGVNNV